MSSKKVISEKRVCEIFIKELKNASDIAIAELKEKFKDYFKDVDLNKAKSIHFYASIYCAMLPIKDFFYLQQAKRIQEFMIKILSSSDEYYKTMKELSRAHSTWNETLYKPNSEHPFENIAKYIYIKCDLQNQKIKFGTDLVDTPNLLVVYVIEATLILSMQTWKHISECYTIIEEESQN